MIISLPFKVESAAVFADALLKAEEENSTLTVTIARNGPGDFSVVNATVGSNIIYPPNGSEQQQIISIVRLCNGQNEHDFGSDGTCNYCGESCRSTTSTTHHSNPTKTDPWQGTLGF